MLAVNASYYIDNQPSVANELLTSLKRAINGFIGEKIANRQFENIRKDFMTLTKEGHIINAEIEIVRDFIENYYINDITQDDIILNKYSTMIDKMSVKVENILDKIEASELPKDMKTTLINTYDELYSNLINTNFIISQKSTMAYFDSKSNTSILQEA